MGRMSDEWYRTQAKQSNTVMGRDQDFDDELLVDEETLPVAGGAYVQCWLWIADPPESDTR